MQKLPRVLEREPLVDAVFEVRFGGKPLLSEILPGVLFGQLSPKPMIERLPAHEIPQPLRAADRNLAFAPTVKLERERFNISIGDRNVIIGCKLPYPKWPDFKREILDISERISKAGIVGPVERFSLKYVNIIEANTTAGQISKIAVSVKLGDFAVTEDHLSLSVQRQEGEILHLMSVITGAQAQMPRGRSVYGAIVDVDSIRDVRFVDFSAFHAELEPSLEELRQSNKAKFFSCITDAAIQEMGPIYD